MSYSAFVTRDPQPPHPTEPEPTPDSPRFAIGELADQAGVSRRAVRFYVQRGLLPSPEGGGRGSFYTADHLATLLTIKRLQEEGVSLAAIAQRLGLPPIAEADADAEAPAQASATARSAATTAVLPAARWLRVEVADGLELEIREDQLHRFPPAKLAHALAQALEHLAQHPRSHGDAS